MIGLVRSGLLDLSHFDVTEFALDSANEAVAHAAAHAGPFKITVMALVGFWGGEVGTVERG